MNAEEFQDFMIEKIGEVNEKLAVSNTRVGAIEEHLKTLNGKVIKQEAANVDRMMGLKNHSTECPLNNAVKLLQNSAIQTETKASTNSKWWHGMAPVLWLVGGAILTLVLIHSKDMLAFLGK